MATKRKVAVKFNLTDEKIGGLFKMLREKPMFETALEFNLEKYFDTKKDTINYMYRTYLKVKNNPEKFGVSPEVAMEIEDIVSRRNVNKNSAVVVEEAEEKLANIKEADIKDIVIMGRNKASILMDKKMNYLMKNKKALEKESIVNLAKVFGIYFDKSQVVMGQATENIAVMAKIDDGLSPEQAMDALLKHREKVSAEKND